MGVVVGVDVLVGRGVSVGVLVGTGVSVGVTVGVLVGVSAGTEEASKGTLESDASVMPVSLLPPDITGMVETSADVSASTEAEEEAETFSATGTLSGWEASVGAVSRDSAAMAIATGVEIDVGVRVGKGVRVSVGKRVRTIRPEADRELVSINPQANVVTVRKIATKKGNRRRNKGLLSWLQASGLHCLDALVYCCIVQFVCRGHQVWIVQDLSAAS